MTHRIHDIAGLKSEIKTRSEDTRAGRIYARTLHGSERHSAKVAARDDGIRWLLLAYGYLRGLKIAQMESETTLWENRPDATRIALAARKHFNKGPDALSETPEVAAEHWAAFEAMIRADIQQWHARLIVKNAEKKALKAHRAVA